MRRVVGGLAFIAVSGLILTAAPIAGATKYNNDTPIIIPDQGNADLYPSSITVTGMAGPITDVNVGLDGLTHAQPSNLHIALVAPSGQALALQRCSGGGTPAAGLFLTFDDDAALQLPTPLTTGTFKPTNSCGGSTSFPAPGPETPGNPGPALGGTDTFASVFNGLSAIGTWNLYVTDVTAGNAGSIPGGWSLDVKPDVTPIPPADPPQQQQPQQKKKKKCKKGKKKKGKKATAAKKRCKKKKRKK